MNAPAIPGADAVVNWFGGWTSFHDFYLLSLPADDVTAGEMCIHGWVTRSETDARGYFETAKHCVVRVQLDGIRSQATRAPDTPPLPAILFTLTIEPTNDGWAVTWNSSYGCEGRIEARAIELAVEPGTPDPDDGSA